MYAESAAPHFVKSHLLSVEMPTAVTKIALTEILHIKFADVFDVNPDTIGHPGGRLTDLKTGIERQAKPTDYVSKMTTVSPGDATHCTRFLKFLNEITKTHPELVAYLLRLMGYGCTGQMTEELLSVWLGGGANGKTILVDLLTKTLGDYVAILSVKLLASGAQDGSDQELRTIGHLCGARMAFASESSKRLKMDNGLAKKMAAPEKLLGRKLYCNAFSFHPTHKLVISAQELVFEAIDYAIQRRLHVVNFPQRFCRPEDIKDYPGAMLIDKNIGRDLAAERPAILALLLNEARAWYTDGLTKPEIVRQTTESFFTDADDFGQWCTECIIRDSAAFTTNNLWYVSYSRFLESVGREVEYKDVIAKKLVGRGFKSEQRNIGRGYVGFRLKDNSDAE
jgi:putative DNA primase/helicase